MIECGIPPSRTPHKTLFSIMDSFSREYFRKHDLRFLGGTSLALSGAQEYRVSDDIDFGCTNPDAFRKVYNDIRSGGVASLCAPGNVPAPAKRDRPIVCERGYACRLFFDTSSLDPDRKIPAKCEIILEARIKFDPPTRTIFGFPALSIDDCFATKLLANADREMDTTVMFRDVFDIFVLLDSENLDQIPEKAMGKAMGAYCDAEKQYLSTLRRLGMSLHATQKNIQSFSIACKGLCIETKTVSKLKKRLEQQLHLYGIDQEIAKNVAEDIDEDISR